MAKINIGSRAAACAFCFTGLITAAIIGAATGQSAALANGIKATTSPIALPPANFQGNATALAGPQTTYVTVQRQSDCSLTLFAGAFAPTFTSGSVSIATTVVQTVPHYEAALHTAAGLTTTPDVFAHGCTDPVAGLGSKRAYYVGTGAQNLLIFALAGENLALGKDVLFTYTIDPTTKLVKSTFQDSSMGNVSLIAAGDLTGDGLPDLVGIDASSPTFSVWTVNTDGSVKTPVTYTVPGVSIEAAVLADFNGDGKLDVLVASIDSSNQERISVLTGNGNGTLNTAQTVSIATPTSGGVSVPIKNLIAADLRGSGKNDVIATNGLVLINGGAAAFTVSTGFAAVTTTSDFSPNLVSADFNKDGKIDVAVDNGSVINVYNGKGDGTFAVGASYDNNPSVGYLTASDLDGDGNVDLWVGLGDGGVFTGDPHGLAITYALMGDGDGTFKGAPITPFNYTGNNLADLNGDGIMDGVGLNTAGTGQNGTTLTAYLGDGKGGFTASASIAASPVSIAGTQYTVDSVDSFAIGDVNGDTFPDLVYVAPIANQPAGVFIALGDGMGGFAAPVYVAAASWLAADDIEVSSTITNLRLADVNHDGKLDLIYGYAVQSYKNQDYEAGTAVQLGVGNGTFQSSAQMIPYYAGQSQFYPTSKVALIADLNKDGNPDLIFLTQTSTIDQTLSTYVANIQIALGRGDGTFAALATVAGPDLMRQISSQSQYAPLAVADMNGDGHLDLVALGASTSTYDLQVAIALGVGDGTFKLPAKTTYSMQSLPGQGLAVADFDADGKLDVAITNPYLPGSSGISLGNGDGTIRTGSTASIATAPNLGIAVQVGGATVAIDLNGDGRPDILSYNVQLLSQSTASTATPDFALSSSAAAGSVDPGQSATATLTVTPANGFAQAVSFACTGLPAGATCSFSPATVTPVGAATTTVLTIATSGASLANAPSIGLKGPPALLLAGLLPLVLRRRRCVNGPHAGLSVCLLLVMATLFLQGCSGDRAAPISGGGSSSGGSSSSSSSGSSSSGGSSSSSGGGTGGTPAGAYSVTVTATSGAVAHSVAYTLTVN